MTRAAITQDNVSPLLEILIWFCLIVSSLTVLVRLAIKRLVLHRTDLDDYFIIVSLCFASAQSIALSLATSNGLGQRLDSLDARHLSALFKAQYSAEFLSITSLCFAKLSFVVFLRNLTPLAFDRNFAFIIGLVVVLWASTATLTVAFQCSLPKPWDYVNQSCFNRTSWANYVAVMNILTDVALIALPLVIVARLNAANNKKITLVLFFITRVCVITAVVCQMIYLNRLKPSGDLTFDIWPATICTQTVQSLSIVVTCLVYLKPFLDSLETGFIQVGDLRRQHVPGFGYRPEEASRNLKWSKLGLSFSSLRSKLSRSQHRNEEIELQENAGADVQDSGNTAPSDAGHHDWDAHSRSHILQTTTLTVERHRENAPLSAPLSAQFAPSSAGPR